ncbi:hypothetical protein HT136_05025 [Novosphingobium profundi]|uniref:hypothetical protein n=1 Tax=Novosphingobium profundi TaxID=1774954 RepID=UPI001BDB6360|nr:hypothetical protein [Novosphingobium profundi]MBT0667725.1 hypothetical protein [Novosphingobium profundi]
MTRPNDSPCKRRAPTRRALPQALLAALVMVTAAGVPASAQSGPGEDPPGALEGTVALALADASTAAKRADTAGLERALRIIERSGARPLPDWTGEDPVVRWRAAAAPDVRADDPVYRGSPVGPGYRAGRVIAGASEHFEQVFLSGRKASVALSTPGKAALSLRVVDRDRRAVCEGHGGACQWVPLFTQRYAIEIRNRGENPAEYFLVVQ